MAADTKRASMSAKVATPKASAQGQGPSGDLDAALSKAVGAGIHITTSANTTLEGTLFTACPLTNLVAINTDPATAPNKGSFHILPVAQISSFRLTGSPAGGAASFADAIPPLARLDTRALQNREDAAVRKQKEYDASRGKGVSREGQDIFDALARTLPTRWHETSIIVSDAVIIQPPYHSENCSAPPNQQKALQRVRQVLENERNKLAQRKPAATPAPAVRKGG